MKKQFIFASLFLLSSTHSYAQNTFPTSGNAGIGTTSPSASLDILTEGISIIGGTINLPSFKITNKYYDHTAPTSNIVNVSRQHVQSGVPQTPVPYFVVGPDGKVAINKATASHPLDVSGTIRSDDMIADNSIYAWGNIESGNEVIAYNRLMSHADLQVQGYSNLIDKVYMGNTLTVASLLNGGGGRMVVADAMGTLDVQKMPTLDFTNGVLTLSNLGSINSTANLPNKLSMSGNTLHLMSGSTSLSNVSIPSGADNLGNHNATTTLNMGGHPISQAGAISGSSTLTIGSTASIGGTVTAGGFSTIGTLSAGPTTITGLTINGNGDVNGDFNIDGDATCTNAAWSGSDKRYKKNIEDINVTNELFQIKSYSYNFKQDEFKSKRFDNRIHFGFIAQEVEETFPNLVKKGSDGYYAVNYIEFIPLLLQALKEEDQQVKQLQTEVSDKTQQLSALEAKMSELENKLNELTNCCTGKTASNGDNSDIGGIIAKSTLEQNEPNPFSVETKIGFNIIGQYSRAFIGVYDLNGKEINRINIIQNSNSVVVKNLQPGMYVYSLIVDGVLIDSKKMVVLGE